MAAMIDLKDSPKAAIQISSSRTVKDKHLFCLYFLNFFLKELLNNWLNLKTASKWQNTKNSFYKLLFILEILVVYSQLQITVDCNINWNLNVLLSKCIITFNVFVEVATYFFLIIQKLNKWNTFIYCILVMMLSTMWFFRVKMSRIKAKFTKQLY